MMVIIAALYLTVAVDYRVFGKVNLQLRFSCEICYPLVSKCWHMYAFSLEVILLIAMVVVIAMAMVSGMVIIEPEVCRYVSWIHQCQCQSIYRFRAIYQSKLPQTQSFPSTNSFL